MDKKDIKVGQSYTYMDTVTDNGHHIKKERRVCCIGVHKHFARFDFGGYPRSLAWDEIIKGVRA